MRLKTKKYDVANYLDSGEMIAAYLDAFESGDTSRITAAAGPKDLVVAPAGLEPARPYRGYGF